MSGESKRVQNISSSLLTPEENLKVFIALGRQCTTLSTTIAQLYLTEAPYHITWVEKFYGVVCFVKDHERCSFFIKLFDLDKGCWTWEQDLKNTPAYKPACAYFHVFVTDKCMVGLSFANNDEAVNFKSAVQKKLHQRDERQREKRRGRQVMQPLNIDIVASGAKPESSSSSTNGNPLLMPKKKEAEKMKKKLTKEDISDRTNLHVQNVGWHPEKGFIVESVDEELKAFFNMAGVSNCDLKDYDTRNFIYDFIVKHGGIERTKQEIVQKIPPPPPPLVPRLPKHSSALLSPQALCSALPPHPAHTFVTGKITLGEVVKLNNLTASSSDSRTAFRDQIGKDEELHPCNLNSLEMMNHMYYLKDVPKHFKNCMAGLNFVNDDEDLNLEPAVQETFHQRGERERGTEES